MTRSPKPPSSYAKTNPATTPHRLPRTGQRGNGVDTAKVLHTVRDRLPDYMVPSALIVLDRLPLRPTGNSTGSPARPRLHRVRCRACRTNTHARSPVRALRRCPGTARGRRDDDFFDLGGDSIVSIQFVSPRPGSRAGLLAPRRVPAHDRDARSLWSQRTPEPAPRAGTGRPGHCGAATPIMHRLRELGGPVDRPHSQGVLRPGSRGAGSGRSHRGGTGPPRPPRRCCRASSWTVRAAHGSWRSRRPARSARPMCAPRRRSGLTDDALSRSSQRRQDPPERLAQDGSDGSGRLARLRPATGRAGCCSSSITWSSTGCPGGSCCPTRGRLERPQDRPQLQPVGTSFRRWAVDLTEYAQAPERERGTRPCGRPSSIARNPKSAPGRSGPGPGLPLNTATTIR